MISTQRKFLQLKVGDRVFVCERLIRQYYPHYFLPPQYRGIGLVKNTGPSNATIDFDGWSVCFTTDILFLND